jgi:hypothetical protein
MQRIEPAGHGTGNKNGETNIKSTAMEKGIKNPKFKLPKKRYGTQGTRIDRNLIRSFNLK